MGTSEPTRAVPALHRGLRVLRILAGRPSPITAAAIARELGIARSSTYELLTELADAGFVVHLAGERRWGLGVAAFEIGQAYLRGQPLHRLGAPIVHRLAAAVGELVPGATAQLGVLHGGEVLYLLKERHSATGPTLVTDVGVRLPAPLTATGLSLLAGLPAAQVRALFPSGAAFVDRTGSGPRSLPALRADLRAVAARGWAVEHGRVSPDTASVAAAAVDHSGRPLAAMAVTVRHVCPGCDDSFAEVAGLAVRAAEALTAAIGGRIRSSGARP